MFWIETLITIDLQLSNIFRVADTNKVNQYCFVIIDIHNPTAFSWFQYQYLDQVRCLMYLCLSKRFSALFL